MTKLKTQSRRNTRGRYKLGRSLIDELTDEEEDVKSQSSTGRNSVLRTQDDTLAMGDSQQNGNHDF